MTSIICNKIKYKKQIKKGMILFFWFLVWQVVSMIVKDEILMVDPIKVMYVLGDLMGTAEFYRILLYSCQRVAKGIGIAFLIGSFMGIAAYRFSILEEIFAPILTLMRAIPVASFVILALIWAGSENLTFCVVFVIATPLAYSAMLTGCHQVPQEMMEMSKVFHMSFIRKVWYIYRPACLPFLLNAVKMMTGLGWKSGTAAEVIGTPAHSIGERLYMAKIYLETGELFAWTFVIIVLSFVFEWIVTRFFRLVIGYGIYGKERNEYSD